MMTPPDDVEQRAAFSAHVQATNNKLETPEERTSAAMQELIGRELCRRRLLPFVMRFKPSYDPGWVHKDICTRLEQFSQDVANGLSPRLMLFMPPRSGKSELVSRNFPAWHLGNYPEHEFIATSYSSALAFKFSRSVRSLLREPDYNRVFPDTQLDPDTQSVEYWQTTQRGAYMAAGVSGPLTGNGMHIGVIDDPVKNREEADSENVRQSIKEWYTSTFYTRLAPGGGILIVLTRWHHDDLAGWLLEEAKNGGDQWETVVYPAIAEVDEVYRQKGEALHPARYPLEALARIRNAIGDRDFTSLYQQRPTADEGAFFRREWMRFYDIEERPPISEMSIYAAWDLAIGKKSENDETVGVTVGIDRQERAWVLDLVHGRWDALEICDAVLDSWRLWKPSRVGIERGQIFMTLGPLLRQRIKERSDWSFPLDEDGLRPGKSDKMARAAPIQGRMRQGMVYIPRHAVWREELVQQLLQFPNARHDDMVDAIAWIGQMLQLFSTVTIKQTKSTSWRDKIPQLLSRGLTTGTHMSS